VVGRPGVYAGGYFRRCQRVGRDHVRFIDRLDHSALLPVYRQASAFVNASWYETPGLANLEAAACGCRLVVTDRGCTKEYFGEYATYCDPADAGSIADAIADALRRPHDPIAQAAHVARFSWERTAAETLAAYDKCLAIHRAGASS
jgi:glycosyltransferase involved in cell wall biosynthesis